MAKCVLIYDDDEEILTVCKVILDKDHYRVETLPTCENILEDISQIKPDIILMDLWIPDIGGEGAVKIIKENIHTKDIPVVLFSAVDEIEKVSRRINANGYLKKPFEIAELRRIIESCLG